jgi:hypothetical protein
LRCTASHHLNHVRANEWRSRYTAELVIVPSLFASFDMSSLRRRTSADMPGVAVVMRIVAHFDNLAKREQRASYVTLTSRSH